jgi:hypothetical protein
MIDVAEAILQISLETNENRDNHFKIIGLIYLLFKTVPVVLRGIGAC